MISVSDHLKGNPYPGRGILLGAEAEGTCFICAYFIMGRSVNSRNRVFAEEGETLFTRPFDESLVKDPSLIIYTPVRRCRSSKGDCLVVTNGDQTDTVCEFLEGSRNCGAAIDFHKALLTRTYEPDAPNYTPRISGMIHFASDVSLSGYEMSILRRESRDSAGEDAGAGMRQEERRAGTRQDDCERAFWQFGFVPGEGRLIHTYRTDGDPIPSFEGDPVRVSLPAAGSSEETERFAGGLWDALDPDNRISLCVRRYTVGGELLDDIIINKNK